MIEEVRRFEIHINLLKSSWLFSPADMKTRCALSCLCNLVESVRWSITERGVVYPVGDVLSWELSSSFISTEGDGSGGMVQAETWQILLNILQVNCTIYCSRIIVEISTLTTAGYPMLVILVCPNIVLRAKHTAEAWSRLEPPRSCNLDPRS